MGFEPVVMEELFEFIMTRPPYFSLQNMSYDREKNIFMAEITPEQSLGAEVGPISTSEAGRHLAIAGLCHLALNRKSTSYYLVEKTRVERSHYVGIDRRLSLLTNVQYVNGRNAVINANLTTLDGTLIYSFTVSYFVVPKAVFQRKYRSNRIEPILEYNNNPYRRYPPNTSTIEQRDKVAKSHLMAFDSRDCVGHYPGFPFIPVAILVESILYEISKILDFNFHKNVMFRLSSADMHAAQMIPVNTVSEIKTNIITSENYHHTLESSIYSDNTQICNSLCNLEIVDQ